MRTKRTIISMVVFLSVFWLSIVFSIEKPSSYVQGTLPAVEDSMAIIKTDANEEAAPGIMSYSYDSSQTVSLNNKLYGARFSIEDIAEAELQEAAEDYGHTADSTDAANITEASDSQTRSFTVNVTDSDEGITPAEEASDQKATVSAAEATSTADDASIPEKTKEEPSEYANIGISIANNYVNIREKADQESKVLGKLYKDAAAEILETKEDWYHVESGSVKGYVKAEFIKTGIPDEELIAKYGVLRINVNVDGLNVREKPTTESDKLTTVYQNERYPVIELQDLWVKVDITDDRVIGYVRRDLIDLIVDFRKAVSKEEEAELLRLQAEERAKQETAVKYRDEVDYTNDELRLLACLVHSEAGNQCYEGKLAVANIVLNRVKSSKYADTIKKVIYQPGQFTVASSGSLEKQLTNYSNYSSSSQKLSIKAA